MAEDKMLERIRALLAKAEDPGVTQAESELFTAKALELAAKYEIDNALIHARPDVKAEEIESRRGTVQKPWSQMQTLLNQVSVFCGVKMIQLSGTEHNAGYTLIGHVSDLDRTEMLFTSLLVQGTRWVTYDYRKHVETCRDQFSTPDRRSTYKRSWWAHFTLVISERLREIKEAAARASAQARINDDTGPSTALVLADRGLAVTQEVERQFPALKRARQMRTGVGGGASAGAAAGRRADLGSGKLGSSSRALPRGNS